MAVELQPVDDFVLKGFLDRFQQQFGCLVMHVTTNEEAAIAQLTKGGANLEYPYAFVRIQNWAPDTESYNPAGLARRGLIAMVEDNNLIAHRVRLIPTVFEAEIKYVTDKFRSTQMGSALAFVRRWLLLRKNGGLQFNIRYGRIAISIRVTLSESVPFSPRENAPDAETAYSVLTNATIHGYMSEPVMGTQGIVSQVALQELLEAEGLSGGTFIPFN